MLFFVCYLKEEIVDTFPLAVNTRFIKKKKCTFHDQNLKLKYFLPIDRSITCLQGINYPNSSFEKKTIFGFLKPNPNIIMMIFVKFLIFLKVMVKIWGKGFIGADICANQIAKIYQKKK